MAGDHAAIADVGETLVDLLRDRMAGLVTDDQVVLASPVDDDLKNKVRLTLFLFDVERSAHGNAEHPTPPGETTRAEPLSLDLTYLLTAHPGKGNGSASTTARTMDEHTVLGRAMQVLRDNAIVGGADLRGSLADADDALHVSLEAQATDTAVNLWNTFQGEPYRPSATYLVSPVEIASRRETPVERVEQVRIEEHARNGDDDG